MGLERYIYVGKYLRVWPPKIKVERGKWCPGCSQKAHGYYCSYCGSETEPLIVETISDMRELFEELFSSFDHFYLHKSAVGEHVFIMPNLKAQTGGMCLDTEEEVPFPDEKLSDDFYALMNELDSRDIKHEIAEGILSYWW